MNEPLLKLITGCMSLLMVVQQVREFVHTPHPEYPSPDIPKSILFAFPATTESVRSRECRPLPVPFHVMTLSFLWSWACVDKGLSTHPLYSYFLA
jgi:hypothetical protein